MTNWKRGLVPMMLLLATLFTVGACKKYAEGPAFSLRSPEARLTQQWRVSLATEANGDDITDEYENFVIDFQEDNTLILREDLANGQTYETVGTWALTDDKLNIISTYEFDFGGITYTTKDTVMIQKLSNSELWIETDMGEQRQHVPAN